MKYPFFLLFIALIGITASAQVGINTTTPNPNAALDINSTSQGVLLPRMSEAERDAIPDPIPAGLLIYCNNCGSQGEIQVFDGESWTNLSGNPVAAAPFVCGTSKVSFQYNGTSVKYGTVVGAGGRCWLDRNLGASQVASAVDDVQGFGHLFQWGRSSDGHQLTSPLPPVTNTLSNSDLAGHGMFILPTGSPYDWRFPQNANLWQGETGTNKPCPNGFRIPTQLEFDSERLSWITNDGAGAFASPLKLTFSGQRNAIDGNIYHQGTNGHYWLSTISPTHNHLTRYFSFHQGDAGIFQLSRAAGMAVRCIMDTNYPGSIGSLDCSGATINGTLKEGIAASGVSAVVSYANGNGAAHSGQTVLSSGVSGLTATLVAGTFISGTGSLTYTITGTPDFEGTAEFELNIGGQMCILNLEIASAVFTCGTSNVTFTYNGNSVTYGTVVGAGGRCWLDRNLGATQVATSSNDAAAFGDLFQWGRGDDGHQIRTSSTINTLSNTDSPGHGNFIFAPNIPTDWRSPQNSSLWQGINGVNNPCPSGFRLPTRAELDAERLSWGSNQNSIGAFASPLKLPLAQFRHYGNGNFFSGTGAYWSSTIISRFAHRFRFSSTSAYMNLGNRADGVSVRCIKE